MQAQTALPLGRADQRPAAALPSTPQPQHSVDVHWSLRSGFASQARALWTLGRATVKEWADNGAPLMGAGLAYFAVFSLAPLLLLLIGITGLVLGADDAHGVVFAQLSELLGAQTAASVEEWVKEAQLDTTGTLSTMLGLALLVVGGTTLFAHVQTSLHRLWVTPGEAVTRARPSMVRSRLFALALIAGLGVLVLAAIIAGAVLRTLVTRLALDGFSTPLLWAVDVGLGFALMTLLFAAVFRTVARRQVSWRATWVGAAFTAALMAVGRMAISAYIGHAGVGSGFGAASAFAALLVWVYYSAQVFLLGAQATWTFARLQGLVSASGDEPLS